MRENHQKHRRRLRRRPNGAAAFGGRPIGSVFLIILYHKYLWIYLIYSLYIPFIFPRYVPCIFPCVFLNLWSQEKISPYSKTTFLLLKFQGLRFLYFLLIILWFFIKIIIFYPKSGPYGPIKALWAFLGN